MKPLKLIAILLTAIACAITSTNAQTLSVHLKNGNVVNYTEAELDYIQFSESTQGDDPAELSVVGTWKSTSNTSDGPHYTRLYEDGTYIEIDDSYDCGLSFSHGLWSCDGNTLIMKCAEYGFDIAFEASIIELTATEMHVSIFGFHQYFERVPDSTIDHYLPFDPESLIKASQLNANGLNAELNIYDLPNYSLTKLHAGETEDDSTIYEYHYGCSFTCDFTYKGTEYTLDIIADAVHRKTSDLANKDAFRDQCWQDALSYSWLQTGKELKIYKIYFHPKDILYRGINVHMWEGSVTVESKSDSLIKLSFNNLELTAMQYAFPDIPLVLNGHVTFKDYNM